MTDTEREDDEPIFIVCQGPPFCLLLFEDAIQAQNNGCLKCRRVGLSEALQEETLQ